MTHPLAPFASWGWEPPYRTRHPEFSFSALVKPIHPVPAFGISGRNCGIAHIISSAASVKDGCRLRYGARWLCGSSNGTGNATFLEALGAFALCRRCEDARSGPAMYHCLDADGKLLYIGSTGRIGKRMQSHQTQTPWWHRVAHVDTKHYPTLPEARAAEYAAIFAENPPRNKRHRNILGCEITDLMPPEPTANGGTA